MAYRECDLREENNERAKPLLRFFFFTKGRRQLVVTSEPRDRDGCCVDGIVSEDGNRCERKARAALGYKLYIQYRYCSLL